MTPEERGEMCSIIQEAADRVATELTEQLGLTNGDHVVFRWQVECPAER